MLNGPSLHPRSGRSLSMRNLLDQSAIVPLAPTVRCFLTFVKTPSGIILFLVRSSRLLKGRPFTIASTMLLSRPLTLASCSGGAELVWRGGTTSCATGWAGAAIGAADLPAGAVAAVWAKAGTADKMAAVKRAVRIILGTPFVETGVSIDAPNLPRGR